MVMTFLILGKVGNYPRGRTPSMYGLILDAVIGRFFVKMRKFPVRLIYIWRAVINTVDGFKALFGRVWFLPSRHLIEEF